MRAAEDSWNAAVKVADGNFVAVRAGVHTSDEANIVGDSAGLGQEFGQFGTALSVFPELPACAQQLLAGCIGETVRDIFFVIRAVELCEFRFRIRQVHVRWTAVLKQ